MNGRTRQSYGAHEVQGAVTRVILHLTIVILMYGLNSQGLLGPTGANHNQKSYCIDCFRSTAIAGSPYDVS